MTQTTATEYLDCTHLLDEPAALKAFAAEHGYLFFRQYLPRELVLDLRRRFLEILADENLVILDDALTGTVNTAVTSRFTLEDRGTQGAGIRDHIYIRAQKLEAFHALPHHPKLLALYRTLFDDEVLVHPRHIARLMVPGPGLHPTPPHQDFIHIQGTENVWTCWMPIGDCPQELGGLALLDKSHQAGLLPITAAEGAGGMESWMCDNPYEWITTTFYAGDILTFPSLSVHKGLPHRMGDVVRLSCDYRFQPQSEPIEQNSLHVHGRVTTWEDIYEDWTGPTPRFYWKNFDLKFKEWDEHIRWQKEKIC